MSENWRWRDLIYVMALPGVGLLLVVVAVVDFGAPTELALAAGGSFVGVVVYSLLQILKQQRE